MPAISISSTNLTLHVKTKLAESDQALSRAYEKLSSGLRINRPSDDAAGFAISSRLESDRRVYGQGVRNINDGISLVNVAQGAVEELGNITGRLRELAEQASNSVLNSSQRLALDQEGLALTNEYNRIVASTSYNSLQLLSTSLGQVSIQGGFGSDGRQVFDVTAELARRVGAGTYAVGTSYAAGDYSDDLAISDLNQDGILDIIQAATTGDSLHVLLGTGNGTFQASSSYGAGDAPTGVVVADFNGDGLLDLASSSNLDDGVSVLLGNGNGTFKARVSYGGGDNNQSIVSADMNNDGILDLVTSSETDSRINVLIGNGNGTFKARVSYGAASSGIRDLNTGDVDGDGFADLIVNGNTDSVVNVFLGNGDGTLLARQSFSTDATVVATALGDLNFDGYLDIITTHSGNKRVNVLLGNGDGTFAARISYSTANSNAFDVDIADINGDGYSDLVIAGGGGGANILIGNGNGTFKKAVSFATGGNDGAVGVGDFNNDGAVDLALGATGTSIEILLANGTQSTNMPRLNLTTAEEARSALSTLENLHQYVLDGLASLGTYQTLLTTSLGTIGAFAEHSAAAHSKIVDVDVADEVANMLRHQIVRQANVALLAQANQSSSIVLGLLSNF